ncbi:MAG: DUF3106 domain-containing protein [Opitutales bacterium]
MAALLSLGGVSVSAQTGSDEATERPKAEPPGFTPPPPPAARPEGPPPSHRPRLPGPGRAEGEGPPDGPRGDQARIVERLLSLSPEQLAAIRSALEQIEAMSAEERAALRNRLREFRELSEAKRRELRRSWEATPPDVRRALHWYRLQQTPEERQAERERILRLPPEERRAALAEIKETALEAWKAAGEPDPRETAGGREIGDRK